MEIGRFVYGGFQIPNKSVEETQSICAKLPKHNIGEIEEDLQCKIFRPTGELKEGKLEDQTWKVVSKTMLSGVHARFQLKNPNYKIAGILPYFDHCGKYYTVTFIIVIAPLETFETR